MCVVGMLVLIGVGFIVGGWFEQGQGDVDQGIVIVVFGQCLYVVVMCVDYVLVDGQVQVGVVVVLVVMFDVVEYVEDVCVFVIGNVGVGIDYVDVQLVVQFVCLYLYGGVGW